MKQWLMIQNYAALNATLKNTRKTKHFQMPEWER